MYDLIIIGGGPGGVAAGVYAARKKMRTLLITKDFGGQSVVSADIQNWIGEKGISGVELAGKLEEHLRAQEGIEIDDGKLVTAVQKKGDIFTVSTDAGDSLETKTVLVVSGSRRRRLGVPGEKDFEGRGVVFCATCDAPLFRNKQVAVIGGGNSGLEAVLDLTAYATKIYLFERGTVLKGDAVTQEKIKENDKVEIITQAEAVAIEGSGMMVSGFRYKDTKAGEERTVPVQGVFVEIGAQPNSDMVKDLVELNKWGEIVTDPKTQQTSCKGIWAAGDVSDVLYKQNNISAGDAIKAILNIQEHLIEKDN